MPKSKWLQEVEDDAVRIQTKRFDEFFEDQAYKASKATSDKAVDQKESK